MSENDLDLLYESTNARDPARPSAAVRQAILAHARQLAARRDHQQPAMVEERRVIEPRRPIGAGLSKLVRSTVRLHRTGWQIAAPVAAAVLAAIVLQPQLRSVLREPAKRETVPAAPAGSSQMVRPRSASALQTAPPPPRSGALSTPEPFPAEAALPHSEHPRTDFDAASGAPRAPPPPAASAIAQSPRLAAAESPTSAARAQAGPAAAPRTERRESNAASPMDSDAGGSQSESFQQAAARGDLVRVRTLLQLNGALINTRDASGRTALLLAVLQDRDAVVRALLEHGADPNIADAGGHTPLAAARERHQRELVEELLQAGAR